MMITSHLSTLLETRPLVLLQLFENEQGSKWRQLHVETAPFYTSKQVDHLIKETEVRYDTRLPALGRLLTVLVSGILII
jgi:hypothetical protein